MPVAQTGPEPGSREGGAGLRIRTHRDGGAVVLCLHGELDIHTAVELRELLADEQRRGGAAAVVVDMDDVGFVDSTGLATLLNALRRLTRANRRLVLVAGPGPVTELLRMTRLDSTFTVFATVPSALAALETPPRAA